MIIVDILLVGIAICLIDIACLLNRITVQIEQFKRKFGVK